MYLQYRCVSPQGFELWGRLACCHSQTRVFKIFSHKTHSILYSFTTYLIHFSSNPFPSPQPHSVGRPASLTLPQFQGLLWWAPDYSGPPYLLPFLPQTHCASSNPQTSPAHPLFCAMLCFSFCLEESFLGQDGSLPPFRSTRMSHLSVLSVYLAILVFTAFINYLFVTCLLPGSQLSIEAPWGRDFSLLLIFVFSELRLARGSTQQTLLRWGVTGE